jgi:hypothetical protein
VKIAILAQIATLPLLGASESAYLDQSRGTAETSIPRLAQPAKVVSPFNLEPNSVVTPVRFRGGGARGRGPGFRGGHRRGGGMVGPAHGRPGGFHGRRHRRW